LRFQLKGESCVGAFFLRRINDHLQYLNRVEATLEGRGDFRGTDHHNCKLGKWIDSEGPGEASSVGEAGAAMFESLKEPHRLFHEASDMALKLQEAGRRELSQQQFTRMYTLSRELVDNLLELDRLAQERGTKADGSAGDFGEG
jgi:hypothetical protein